MVLYHAISSYQLLEVILHRFDFHKKEKAILILPDFIVNKYPQYQELQNLGFFEEVYLFPYLLIPHNPKTIINDVVNAYLQIMPYDIHSFSKIYIAGAHFYFSLYLIENNIKFDFFEDAAGMLSRSDELYQNLSVKFPVHAQIAQKNGLFDGSCSNVENIYCLKRTQKLNVVSSHYVDFDVGKALKKMLFVRRNKIVRFFIPQKIKTDADTILLTQHFANLGIMSLEKQKELYQSLKEKYFKDNTLIIKKHPDDTLDYSEIFCNAQIIKEIFPSELLPYVFQGHPKNIVTISSTSVVFLQKHFHVKILNLEV